MGEEEDAHIKKKKKKEKNTKLSCFEMKCGANKYLHSRLMEVLDHNGKEEKYSQGTSAPMDFGLARAL